MITFQQLFFAMLNYNRDPNVVLHELGINRHTFDLILQRLATTPENFLDDYAFATRATPPFNIAPLISDLFVNNAHLPENAYIWNQNISNTFDTQANINMTNFAHSQSSYATSSRRGIPGKRAISYCNTHRDISSASISQTHTSSISHQQSVMMSNSMFNHATQAEPQYPQYQQSMQESTHTYEASRSSYELQEESHTLGSPQEQQAQVQSHHTNTDIDDTFSSAPNFKRLRTLTAADLESYTPEQLLEGSLFFNPSRTEDRSIPRMSRNTSTETGSTACAEDIVKIIF